ncbi:hypothetical protein B0H16DRAFT_1713801 [Mycena metata]|uniref:Protein TsetseEP domain-containing protein n=1 Tax=Mycena metata TaxID=1033252 RepID=A0AAD7JZQ5_9AGAR|nr:hypothetical protein B0H16DRAFT_1713801 [Mycena metata]
MQSFSATFLVAVLSTSVLTTAAPLFQVRANNNNNNNNNNGDLQSQFSVACATVNIAGNGTFAAIALVNQMKTNDQKVTDQLSAINATLVSAITAGEEARPVCEANAVSPDPNQLESQFSTACASVDVAGSLTGTTIGLLNGVQRCAIVLHYFSYSGFSCSYSNDQNIASQLAALKATMSAVNTAGQFANVACAAGRALTGESNNNSNANANASSNNNANGNNSNNGSISSNSNSNSNNNSNKNNANANNAATKNSSTSTSTISKVTQTQNASGSQKTQSK